VDTHAAAVQVPGALLLGLLDADDEDDGGGGGGVAPANCTV
jgi:hypothetical protein